MFALGPFQLSTGEQMSGALSVLVVPMTEAHAADFRESLDVVAREKRYLAQIEAPPLERVQEFVRQNVANDAAQFAAVLGDRVVGWADILPAWAQALAHRGSLGMGVLPEFRGQGIGKRLLQACISKAWAKGITRVDLECRIDNVNAIRLYESVGFRREAVKRNAMRFDGVYYDAVEMTLLKDAG